MDDCKQTLEKSREKILKYEEEIRKLQQKLQENEIEIRELKENNFKLQQCSTSLSNSRVKTFPSSKSEIICDSSTKSHQNITTNMMDLNFSLVSLSLITSKITSLLNKIRSTQAFVQASQLCNSESSSEFVEETDIVQLQNYIRQCTLLSLDVSNIWKCVKKLLLQSDVRIRVQWEMEQIEMAINDLAVSANDADLLFLTLSKATFFNYLTKSKETSKVRGREMGCSKNVSDFMAMIENVKLSADLIKGLTKFVDTVIKKIKDKTNSLATQSKVSFDNSKYNSQTQTKELNRGENKEMKSIYETERLQERVDQRNKQDFCSQRASKKSQSEEIGDDEITRKINKTLAKIKQIERGEYIQDTEFCKHLVEQINALSANLKSLYEDFNIKSLQDHFSEYTSVTLNKLETLAKQSRDTVLSAEAQISAYRSNINILSQKLKDTEELLRESISECLSLKQNLNQVELLREVDKANFGRSLEEKLLRVPDLNNRETAVKEIIPSKTLSTRTIKPTGACECMCKQRSDHKLCEEKVSELKENVKKSSAELKVSKKEEKNIKSNKAKSKKSVFNSISQKENWQEIIKSLESKNASLLKELKSTQNRLKNLESYRLSEMEGFKTDYKNLQSKIRELQNQLTQSVIIYENDQNNIELLKSIHATAQRSKTAVETLKRLKAKIYELENDIKRI